MCKRASLQAGFEQRLPPAARRHNNLKCGGNTAYIARITVKYFAINLAGHVMIGKFNVKRIGITGLNNTGVNMLT